MGPSMHEKANMLSLTRSCREGFFCAAKIVSLPVQQRPEVEAVVCHPLIEHEILLILRKVSLRVRMNWIQFQITLGPSQSKVCNSISSDAVTFHGSWKPSIQFAPSIFDAFFTQKTLTCPIIPGNRHWGSDILILAAASHRNLSLKERGKCTRKR